MIADVVFCLRFPWQRIDSGSKCGIGGSIAQIAQPRVDQHQVAAHLAVADIARSSASRVQPPIPTERDRGRRIADPFGKAKDRCHRGAPRHVASGFGVIIQTGKQMSQSDPAKCRHRQPQIAVIRDHEERADWDRMSSAGICSGVRIWRGRGG